KRMIAYTSVNHMGYVVVAVGAAGLVSGSDEQARAVAVTGAVTQMVSHGLITGALFLLAGVLQDRAGSYDLHGYGGLAAPAPRFATLFAVGAFASLGLPGFTGFIAEFQIFTGSIAAAAVTALALPGILVTAALFLRALQLLFTGPVRGRSFEFTDLRAAETWSAGPLLVLALVLGVLPRPLLDVIEPASRTVVQLVER
ncbi:MAG TPA: proton-conducting transporter membrane subunit, partial [Nocardioidaceae bacterium]|nr:proton-conducting transporter membrane subunit [Nocardioidaceae bacterium]